MPIRVALIGTGNIAVANHLPGIALCRDATVTALCDPNPAALNAASRSAASARRGPIPYALLREADIDAVIIATPNKAFTVIWRSKRCERGLHVFCEKPLAMTVDEARQMVEAAERAGVRHMTAFTYRFVPAMSYLRHLVTSGAIGTPWHFRAQRFQDWGRRAIGWRQRSRRPAAARSATCSRIASTSRTSHRPDRASHGADASDLGDAADDGGRSTSRTPRTGLAALRSSSAARRACSRA